MIILLVIMVVTVIIFLNHKIKQTNYYENLFNDVKKYENIESDLECVNLGSTFANYAFDYSDLGMRGFNFAINGQNLEYDYKILKHYKDKISAGAKVFITCADLELIYVSSKQYFQNVRVYKYYRGVLPFNEVPFYFKYYLAYILFPIIKINSVKYLFSDSEIYDKKCYENNIMTTDQIEADAKRRLKGWESMFGIRDWNNQSMVNSHRAEIDENIDYIKLIIKYCRENNWHPYIVVPPVSYVLNRYISSEFIESNLINYLKKIAETENVLLLDYSRNELFQDTNLYVNSACLNKKGRRLFLETLLKDIKDCEC